MVRADYGDGNACGKKVGENCDCGADPLIQFGERK
jgi:hypothetical protein